MSGTFPLISLASLVLLSIIAKQRNYLLTSAGLLFVAGGLGVFFAVVFWQFG